ncbi:type ISP restriction/modification enzyme [Mycobacterium tuberculosis]
MSAHQRRSGRPWLPPRRQNQQGHPRSTATRSKDQVTKDDIFYYVYGLLHDPRLPHKIRR